MAVVLIAGSILASVAATVAVNTLIYAAGKELMSSLTPDMPDTDQANPEQDQRLSTQTGAPRKIVYGEAIVGGQIVGYRKTKDNRDDEYHNFVIHIAGHECTSVELWEIEGKTPAEVSGSIGYEVYLGQQTTTPNNLVNTIAGWTVNHIGRGQTYAWIRAKVDPDVFPGGVNTIKWKVKGKRIYDPRLDSTKGGSGTHRYAQKATWSWSNNAELVAVDYVRFSGAKEQPERRFDFDFMAQAANHCDELATHTDRDGISQTSKRFTCNGVLNNAMRPSDGLKEILKSFGARHYRVGSKMYIKPAMYTGPATMTLRAEDSQRSTVIKPHTEESQRCNIVRARFVDPERKYQRTDSKPIVSDNYSPLDGEHLEEDLTFNMVYSEPQAQRLQRYHLEAQRAGFAVQHEEIGIRLDLTAGLYVTYTDDEVGTNIECSIADVKYNTVKNTTELTLKNDYVELYPDDFNAAQQPLPSATTLPTFIDEGISNFQQTDIYDGTNQVKIEWINPFYATEIVIKWQRQESGVTVISTIFNSEIRENNYYLANFKPGVYFIDIRPLDREGNAGAWLLDQQVITNSNTGFTWRIYADDLDGINPSLTDDTKAYIGLLFNQETGVATAADIADQATIDRFTFFKSAGGAGAAGKSAYQLWLENGNTGSLSDFLNSLNGGDGDDGNTWYNVVASSPASGLGLIGDFALCAGSLVYQKTGASTWTFIKDLTGPGGGNGTNGIAGTNGTSITWNGTFATFPSTNVNGYAFYHSGNNRSYVRQDGAWYQMTIDGIDGINGSNGNNGLSIDYQGEFATPPSNPQINWVYRDTDNFAFYLYNGSAWVLMVADGNDGDNGTNGSNGANGQNVYITYHDSAIATAPTKPVNGTGNASGWSTVSRATANWMSQKLATSSSTGVWGDPILIAGRDGTNGTNGTSGTNGINGINGDNGISIIFQGDRSSFPTTFFDGYSFYHTVNKKSYVRQGGAWFQMSTDGISGANGTNGTNGLSINYRGEFTNPPASPQLNWVYRDTDNFAFYLYNGSAWVLMVADGNDGDNGTNGSNGANGQNVYITYHDNAITTAPAKPVNGTGEASGWNTVSRASANWMSQKLAASSSAGVWGNPIQIAGSDGTNGSNGTNGIAGTNGVNGTAGTSIRWYGTFSAYPTANLVNGYAFYHSGNQKSYVRQDGAWYQMTIDGINGINGTNGNNGLSISYRGAFATPPASPQLNWVYRDTDNFAFYLYNGSAWVLMVGDGSDGTNGTNGSNGASGLNVYITYHDNAVATQPTTPVAGTGNANSWSTVSRATANWMSQKLSTSSSTGTWGAAIQIAGRDGQNGEPGPSGPPGADGGAGQLEATRANTLHSSRNTDFLIISLVLPAGSWLLTIGASVTANTYNTSSGNFEPVDRPHTLVVTAQRGTTTIGTPKTTSANAGYSQNVYNLTTTVTGGATIYLRFRVNTSATTCEGNYSGYITADPQ